jgi:hypothetical protein
MAHGQASSHRFDLKDRPSSQPSSIQLPTVGSSGANVKVAGRYGDSTFATGNGWTSLQQVMGRDGVFGGVSVKGRPTAINGGVLCGYKVNGASYRADVMLERHVIVRDLEISGNELHRVTPRITAAHRRTHQGLRAVETVTNTGQLLGLRSPIPQATYFVPRYSHTRNEEVLYRRFVPTNEARQLLGSGPNPAFPVAPYLARHARLLATASTPMLSDVHDHLFFGDQLTQRKKDLQDRTLFLMYGNAFVAMQRLRLRYQEIRTENRGDGAVNLALTKATDSGYRFGASTPFGLRAAHQRSTNLSCRKDNSYKSSVIGREAFDRAVADVADEPMIPFTVQAATDYLTDQVRNAGPDTQHNGLKLSKEDLTANNLHWQLFILPFEPGVFTLGSIEWARSEREDIEVEMHNGAPRVVERVASMRRRNREFIGHHTTQDYLSAAEEWQPTSDLSQPRTLLGVKIKAHFLTTAPQSATALNKLLKCYNELFDLDIPNFPEHAYAAGRQIDISRTLSLEDIELLDSKLQPASGWSTLTQNVGLSQRAFETFRGNFLAATKLEDRCALLRKFVAENDMPALAFLHRTVSKKNDGLHISSDGKAYDAVLGRASTVALKYKSPISAGDSTNCVRARFSEIAEQLRKIAIAYDARRFDPLINDELRLTIGKQLESEAKKLRACVNPSHLGSEDRAVIRERLLDRWFLNVGDRHAAAVMEKAPNDLAFVRSLTHRRSDSALTTREYLDAYDSVMQRLLALRSSFADNVLLHRVERNKRLSRINDAIDHIKSDLQRRRTSADPEVRRLLASPATTYSYLWFLSRRGWRIFALNYDDPAQHSAMVFWPSRLNFLLATLARAT